MAGRRLLFAPSPLLGAFALALPFTTVLLVGAAGCDDSTATGSSGSPALGLDASASNLDGGPGAEASTTKEGGSPAACTEADYVNGVIAGAPAGKVSHHAENIIDAQVIVATGTLPCEARFDPGGGVRLGAGMSGAWDIRCTDTKDAEYYGLHLHGLGKIGDTGAKYAIGKARVVGDALNDEIDLTYVSGSRCGDAAATLREWEGGPSIPGRGSFVVEERTGSSVKFSVSLTDMKPSARNVTGKGSFSLSVTVVDAAPLTVVGLP
jgi:hypothetical protein